MRRSKIVNCNSAKTTDSVSGNSKSSIPKRFPSPVLPSTFFLYHNQPGQTRQSRPN
ncbi:uncharacterized protein G2W53_012867 [Senna tora]|uniref:Uncharacterized protein n=1 Tax=Senna tora TaxID=362788 RepID=A0A834U446_9FABA|nr:uncharacterized protein G2W53_012867 [Senna tora]